MKSVQIALLLALLVPLASVADARPTQSSSYKSGFSSQKSSPARSGGFGSFGSRSATPPPRAPAPAPASRSSGSFGSFGSGASSAPQQSDSALSQRLNKKAAETNAVNTLEARRRAEQDAMNAAARPVPSGPLPQRDNADRYAGRSDYERGMPAPVIIQQNNGNSGLGSMITGFLLARAATPSHASHTAYPGQPGIASTGAAPQAQGGSFFMTLLRTFAWLLIVAVVGWSLYFGWKFLRRGKAPNQANYSFER